MARQSRIHFRGAVYHVLLEGLPDLPIIKSAADYEYALELLADGAVRFNHTVYAYCLLNNRIHLAICVADLPLSKIIQNLSFRYTRFFNGKYEHHGAVFRGRYRALLIEPEPYLSKLVHYIHNAPVRAQLTKRAVDYKWSSHLVYMGMRESTWLDSSAVVAGFGRQQKSALARYARFIDNDVVDDEPLNFLQGNLLPGVLGSKRFASKALRPVPERPKPMSLARLVSLVCKQTQTTPRALKDGSRARDLSQTRQIIAYLALDLRIAYLSESAVMFNRDLTTMSRNQRYFRDRLAQDATLRRLVKQLRTEVLNG